MKLGTKIILGFASLIIIALLLGGLAIWKMSSVKEAAAALADDYMPATAAANNVERESFQTMYEMRGYAFTEDTNYLAKAQQNLAEVKKRLQEAKDLVAKSGDQHLAFLKTASEKAEVKALEYEQFAKQTIQVTEAIERDRQKMNADAQAYMKACSDFLDSQNAKLAETLKNTNATTGLDVASIQDRVVKIDLCNDIVDLGNAIRVGNFKSQATRDPELFREIQKKFPEVYQKLDTLTPITKQEANLKQIEACRTACKSYESDMANFLKNWLDREDLAKKRGAAGDAVLAESKNTSISSMDTSTKTSNAASTSLGTASVTMIIGLCLAVLTGAVLALLITRSITKPIRQVAEYLSLGSEQTTNAAGQVSSSSQSLAEGASEQAASLEETSSSLEEMSSMTQRNSENAQKANELAKEARTAAERGSSDMQAMSSAMEAIKVSSDDIAKIIKTIDEIAFQTNILALNAAVEAARAGEAGMGFAVVADEVRSLAQRSAQAAKETAAKIEGAIGKTAQGVEISGKVASALNDIVSKARQVDELVAEVANASREQTQGISQINIAVSQMDKVTQSNAANAEESAAAAEELNAQAESMKDSVNRLLRLVDGQVLRQSATAMETVRRNDRSKPAVHSPSPAPTAPSNGNGHHTTSDPGVKKTVINLPPASRREEIALDAEFKNF
jgi:methyl-accepting chemotaxis protein